LRQLICRRSVYANNPEELIEGLARGKIEQASEMATAVKSGNEGAIVPAKPNGSREEKIQVVPRRRHDSVVSGNRLRIALTGAGNLFHALEHHASMDISLVSANDGLKFEPIIPGNIETLFFLPPGTETFQVFGHTVGGKDVSVGWGDSDCSGIDDFENGSSHGSPFIQNFCLVAYTKHLLAATFGEKHTFNPEVAANPDF